MANPVLKQIADLQGKSQNELKDLWHEYFGCDPPAFSRGFLVRGLAQRIQELTFGGLPPAYQARLDALVEDKPKRRDAPVTPGNGGLMPGTKLVRDYQGVTHEVTVLADGFEYGGKRYRSLSKIAQTITDTKWNGWLFFGIANPNKRERKSA